MYVRENSHTAEWKASRSQDEDLQEQLSRQAERFHCTLVLAGEPWVHGTGMVVLRLDAT